MLSMLLQNIHAAAATAAAASAATAAATAAAAMFQDCDAVAHQYGFRTRSSANALP
jgi:Spy/CpxP family protein refolding chaperone